VGFLLEHKDGVIQLVPRLWYPRKSGARWFRLNRAGAGVLQLPKAALATLHCPKEEPLQKLELMVWH
jgi:hypothetical protein